MHGWPRTRVAVKRTHANDDVGRIVPRGHQVRAAARAKKALLAGSRFKIRQPIFALSPAELFARHARGGGECRRMRLLAGAAMAVRHGA